MKLTYILAAITLLVATFAMHSEAIAAFSKRSYEGQVINVVPDEEGTNIMMKVDGEFHSIYIPRSNSNEALSQKAIDAQRTKTNFKVSL